MVECPWRVARSGGREAEASLGKGAARRIIHPNEMGIDILRGAVIWRQAKSTKAPRHQKSFINAISRGSLWRVM